MSRGSHSRNKELQQHRHRHRTTFAHPYIPRYAPRQTRSSDRCRHQCVLAPALARFSSPSSLMEQREQGCRCSRKQAQCGTYYPVCSTSVYFACDVLFVLLGVQRGRRRRRWNSWIGGGARHVRSPVFDGDMGQNTLNKYLVAKLSAISLSRYLYKAEQFTWLDKYLCNPSGHVHMHKQIENIVCECVCRE
ncbi:hypothetical protein IQ07DRAFT_320091 [Pyrenochaeta sp. DS3sAY3a]|nr:hypothetical protein IQ07DRAFT_320091 [Pyrenochaeta sp. DS3sAY3a]